MELLAYLKRKNNTLVNFSMIAKECGINNGTVTDLVASLQKKKLVNVEKLGGQKIVRVKQ